MSKIDLTVGTCIINKDKILFILHTKLNLWLFPGGHIDSNETPDMAALREAKEETGLDVEFIDFAPLRQTKDELSPSAFPFHTSLHNVGDHDHYGLYYACRTKNTKFEKNHESLDMTWLSAKEIKKLENIPDGVRKMALYAIKKYA
jgi:8-oxo-dGTP pyrophosphatase MutT (NUDIX family)